MANDARLTLDVDAELAGVALEYGYLAERGAELIAEEVRSSIEISDIPAAAGLPPHSGGPYRDSWQSGKAKRKRNAIVAWAYSMASTDDGESLAEILDEGRGPIHPHPHVRNAVERARRRLDALVGAVNAQLRGAA